jgi:hypothetical protein
VLANVIDDARNFAIERHGAQMYGKGVPYVTHLDEVFEVTKSERMPESLQLAAYLHDLLEDTPTTRDELRARYGEEVTRLVEAVTGVGSSREERTRHTIAQLLEYPEAIPLKMADRYCNTLRCVEDGKTRLLETYRKEWPLYKPVFAKTFQLNLYQWLFELSEGLDGIFRGDDVRLTHRSWDFRPDVELGTEGKVIGVRGVYANEGVRSLWVEFPGHKGLVSVRTREVEKVSNRA